jgi:hypothetical protein
VSRVYFTDRDLGRQFGTILESGALTVERHADHFAPDTADEVWLAEVGRRGWTALTHDRRIRYKPNERDAVMRHRVGLLVIVGAAPFADLARAFLATLPSIKRSKTRSRRLSPKSIARRRAMPRGSARRPGGSNSGIRGRECARSPS